MVKIMKESIKSIPVLHVIGEKNNNKKLPTIFYLHGFTSAKEHNLHIAYLLAEKGFRVILPDALHHGVREKTLIGKDREQSFWEIVLTSIQELDVLKSSLVEQEVIDERQIGVIGTSMGAITMYGALMKYHWIRAAVSFMGTAYYEQFAMMQVEMLKRKGIEMEQNVLKELLSRIREYDLSGQLDKLSDQSLFIWHGKEDELVPFEFSERLYSEIIAKGLSTEHIQYYPEENVAHKVSRQAMLRAITWLERQFPETELHS